MRAFITSAVVVLLSVLTGCANMAPTFDQYQQYSAQPTAHGLVLQVREVVIGPSQSAGWQAAAVSAPIALLASQLVRHKSYATQAAVASTVALGAAVIGNVGGSSRGVQAIVRMDAGNIVSVVQPIEQGNPIVPGEHVLLVGSGRLVVASF